MRGRARAPSLRRKEANPRKSLSAPSSPSRHLARALPRRRTTVIMEQRPGTHAHPLPAPPPDDYALREAQEHAALLAEIADLADDPTGTPIPSVTINPRAQQMANLRAARAARLNGPVAAQPAPLVQPAVPSKRRLPIDGTADVQPLPRPKISPRLDDGKKVGGNRHKFPHTPRIASKSSNVVAEPKRAKGKQKAPIAKKASAGKDSIEVDGDRMRLDGRQESSTGVERSKGKGKESQKSRARKDSDEMDLDATQSQSEEDERKRTPSVAVGIERLPPFAFKIWKETEATQVSRARPRAVDFVKSQVARIWSHMAPRVSSQKR